MQKPSNARLLFHALTAKPSLFALASVLCLACFSGHAGLIYAGSLLYALLVTRDLSTPRLSRRLQAADAELQRRLPESASLSQESLRSVVRALHKGYGDVAQAVERAPEAIRVHVRIALSSLEDLRPQAAQLLRDVDAIHRNLEGTSRESLDWEVSRLRDSCERASAEGRSEYERAIALRREQMAGLDRLKHEYDRLLAALHSIVAAVETFPVRVHQLCLLEARARQDVVKDVDVQLARLDLDLTESQRLLEGLVDDPRQLVARR
jgi:hypothetical protein